MSKNLKEEEPEQQYINLPNFINQNQISFIESDDNVIEEIKKEPITFNLEKYYNFINKDIFLCSLNDFSNDKIIDYFFYDTEKFCQYHLKIYKYLQFKESELDIISLKEFYESEENNGKLEIYCLGGVGISTYLFFLP